MADTFLIGSTQHLLILDDNQFYIMHSGKGLYFGMASYANHIFVAARNDTDCVTGPQSPGNILIFDASTLTLVDTLTADFPLRDMHGIAYIDDKLWITCSYDNLVAIYDFKNKIWTKWYPATNPDLRDRDVNHFNTIESVDDYIGLIAHNYGPSNFLYFDKSSLHLVYMKQFAEQAHNFLQVNNALATCSSAQGLIINTQGWALRTGGYPRGIAQGTDSILVGISAVLERGKRSYASSVIRCFDTNWKYKKDYLLSNIGEITAIMKISANEEMLEPLEKWNLVKEYHTQYNDYNPGNIYSAPQFEPLNGLLSEWHPSEETHRWTAAKEASTEIVINPGENAINITAYNGYDGPYHLDILLNDTQIGYLEWKKADQAKTKLSIPPNSEGRAKLTFKVPSLWSPRSEDQRLLGISVLEIILSAQP